MNEQVILSKRNCHRAAQVRLVAAPENGVYEWNFRGAKGSHRMAFTNSIFGKVERLANNGRSALVLKALEYIKQLQDNEATGLKKPLFTSRHKIWNLQEACEKAVKAQKERENRDSVEIEFDGGRIVNYFGEDVAKTIKRI